MNTNVIIGIGRLPAPSLFQNLSTNRRNTSRVEASLNVVMKNLLALALLAPAIGLAQMLVDCATNTPCSLSGPSQTLDPAWLAFGKINTNFSSLYANAGSALFNNNIVFSTTKTPQQESSVYANPTISGTAGAWPYHSNPSIFSFQNAYDSVNTTTSGSGYLVDVYMRDVPGTNHSGGRSTLWSEMDINGSPNVTAGIGGYVAGQFVQSDGANLGGTSPENVAGNVFGIDSNTYTTKSATYLAFITALEVSTEVAAAPRSRYGIDIAGGGTIQGTAEDAAIGIRAGNWNWGIDFGGAVSGWPLTANSTMIGATTRSMGGSASAVALNGVDFSVVKFQHGGCAFKSTGYCVDPNGNETINSQIAGGETFAIASNCGKPTALTGGATAGSFVAPASAECTVTIKLPTAPHGWVCYASDVTHPVVFKQTSIGATSCTVSALVTAEDVVVFSATGY